MKAIVLSLLPLLLLACRKESEPLPPVTEGRLVSVTLTAAPTQTRSDLVDEDAADSGRDIRVAVYTDGRRVTDGCAPLDLRLMAGRRYNFYAWTGSSLPLGEVPANESDLTGWEAVYPGWETAGDGQSALEDLLGTYGMPMAGSCLDCTPEALAVNQTITVPLQRLFARIRLQVTYDETMTRLLPERNVGTVRVHNWAWACQPFGTGFDREKVRRGSLDIASAPDADGCYTLYLPENLQGELSEGDPDRCSFLSVELSLGDGYGLGGGVGDVCYRFYPGADAGDGYNIRRNRQYNVTLTLSYNGRFIEGTWTVSGDDAEKRQLAFDAENSQAVAPAGGKAYLRLSYRSGDSQDAIQTYYNRFNGVAVGSDEETQAWVADGLIPQSSALEVVGSVRCRHCGNRFWGYPEEAADRVNWAKERMEDTPSSILCPVCRTVLFNRNSPAELRFRSGSPTEADPYQLFLPEPHIAVTIPSDAAVGSVLQIYAVTRDGRKAAQRPVAIGDTSAPYYDQPLEGEQYLAEKIRFTPLSLPADVTQLSYRVVSGAECIQVSRTADNGADISFLQTGTADILVEDQNGTVRLRIRRSILQPDLRFLREEYALAIDGEDLTPEWTYTRQDGSAYSDYDPSLYESLLGDPVLSVDGTWTAVSGGSIHIRRTQDESLGDIPYLSASVGTLTATCPRIPSITAEANLKAVNPFSGWPGTPLSYSVAYGWTESLKKVSSIPIRYDASMRLRNLIGTDFPLYAEPLRGNPPFGYSEAEARAHAAVFPTVAKQPCVTRYYGQVVNRHSGTALKRIFATISVNVEAYCTESHSQTGTGRTHTWTITAVCRNTVGAVPTRNELSRVLAENRTASIYPTSGRWGHGITGCYWQMAYYSFGVQDASYQISLVLENNTDPGTGDATFADFAGQNPVQFTTPYAQEDGYTYLQIEGEPLGSPSNEGVWKIVFNPSWQSD